MQLDYQEIGHNVRLQRTQLGMKQAELAERIDVSSQHISQIECGRTKLSLPVLVSLANALDCDVNALLGTNIQGEQTRRNMINRELQALLEQAPPQKLKLCLAVCGVILAQPEDAS